MGLLTDETTRLCAEINALRRARVTFLKNLERETRERRLEVSEMRANFAFAHDTMARLTKNHLAAFFSGLKGGLEARTRQFRSDLDGARHAWLGPAPVFEKNGRAEAPVRLEKKSKRKIT